MNIIHNKSLFQNYCYVIKKVIVFIKRTTSRSFDDYVTIKLKYLSFLSQFNTHFVLHKRKK